MKQLTLSFLLTTLLLGAAVPAQAGSLENLERERATLIDTMLSGDIGIEERQARLEVTGTRLVDLERMVLRDKSLAGKNTSAVQSAFQNYDLTFLAHASVENDRSITDHWLSSIGLSTRTLVNAHMGRR